MKPRNIIAAPMLAGYGSSIIPAKCAVHKDGAERDLEGVSASSGLLCSKVGAGKEDSERNSDDLVTVRPVIAMMLAATKRKLESPWVTREAGGRPPVVCCGRVMHLLVKLSH